MKNPVIETSWQQINARCKRTEPSQSLTGQGAARLPDNPHYLVDTDVSRTWAKFRPAPFRGRVAGFGQAIREKGRPLLDGEGFQFYAGAASDPSYIAEQEARNAQALRMLANVQPIKKRAKA